ncbi:hypothetical protein [Streptomyces sp. NPDC017988]|uniref:hypothetical protein n=1 Tax=Streptomyces sp. NPDC017988 TaxID=3365025 RepID=UPI0037A054CD
MSEPNLQVTFVSRQEPALTAGVYTLAARQEVAGPGNTHPAKQVLDAPAQKIEVAAPRFALAPQEVLAVHPPPGVTADFSLTLPHLAAVDPLLPWARAVLGKERPWLALLTVTDAEVRLDQGQVCTARTAADLVATAPPDTLFPDFGQAKPAADDRSPLLTVDVTYPTLTTLLPARDELRWLAHVREVEAKKDQRQAGWEPGRCAVVVGNRLPTASGRYTALLVSLEGFADYTFLGGNKPVDGKVTAVRMTALHSWSFTHAPGADAKAAGAFRALADALVEAGRDESLLRLPRTGLGGDDADRHVRGRLERGYAPAAHRMHTGELLPAWYRGPFSPCPVPALPRDRLYPDAESYLIFLPDQGMFDVSYADAYTLGQLLALADPAWLRAVEVLRGRGAELLHQALRTPPQLPGVPEVQADTLAGEEAVARLRFGKLVGSGNLAQRITEGLKTKKSPAAPEPDPVGPADGGTRTDAAAVVAALYDDGDDEEPGGPAASSAAGVARRLRTRLQAVAAQQVAVLSRVGEPVARRLAGLPLEHLVPHEAILPSPSVRFFHVDAQWLDVLDFGSGSVTPVTALDAYLDGLLHQALAAEADEDVPVAGMLLRSTLVSQWPELIVEMSMVKGGPARRVDVFRPQADVLLALFPAIPHEVRVREPARGLSLGIDSADKNKGNGTVQLRAPSGADIGKSLKTSATGVLGCLREPAHAGVLHIHRATGGCLTTLLAKALEAKGYKEALTPAGLALQLVNSAGLLTFTPAASLSAS